MNLCETCRWWSHEKYSDKRLGQCVSPRLMRGYHSDDSDVPDDGARLEDDEGWAIFTGPKFGCIAHEAVNPHSSDLT